MHCRVLCRPNGGLGAADPASARAHGDGSMVEPNASPLAAAAETAASAARSHMPSSTAAAAAAAAAAVLQVDPPATSPAMRQDSILGTAMSLDSKQAQPLQCKRYIVFSCPE